MSSSGAASRAAAKSAAFSLSPARAEASRRNGAASRGPKTSAGKARSAQNALKHGLCAGKHAVLPDEDAEAFAELEASLVEELAPEGALQHLLAGRIARAAWRLERAERIEAELFDEYGSGRARSPWTDGGLALAMIRDGHRTRGFDTLLRYRGTALAELWRALRTLKALQAEKVAGSGPDIAPPARPAGPPPAALQQIPNEPKCRSKADIPANVRGAHDAGSAAFPTAPMQASAIALGSGSSTPEIGVETRGSGSRRDSKSRG
ncbi:MAG: hypothetical protein AAF637_06720 [Pseudomonadota bacterium]